MKVSCTGWVVWVVLAAIIPATEAAADGPRLTARAAIIMDATSGEVIWDRNGSQPLPPASTTKIMTAILAIESGRLDETVRVSEHAAETAPSKINLKPGQRIRVRSLLYALLLNSANDAADVIAEGLADSEEDFADRMNAKARQIGATTAHFVNPHGLTAPGHHASARDLALIFRYGLRLPMFREVLATRSTQVAVEAPSVHWISLHSHNRLLTGYTYPVIGKTGYTRPARRCFVGAASQDDRELIIAILGATDLWGDARRLFGYGFSLGESSPPVVMAGALPIPTLLQDENTTAEGDDEEAADDIHPAPPHGHYAIQFGPYRKRRIALATRAGLARHGYTAVLSGRTLRLGSFSNRRRAERLARRLRSSGYQPLVVAVR
ncbi:MAG TPA: D-alanyl-D-alanine carboxypeptidase family protein [Candidatus Nitrosopolaris sp.]|nr:D-alanyl-D-alanine carboxypeptidase family protein [Candidatus Nitrosopolaris sp.]